MSKDWERYKVEITRLYVTHRKPLREVRRLMKGRHGFDASIRSYRIRLKEWHAMRNGPLRESDIEDPTGLPRGWQTAHGSSNSDHPISSTATWNIPNPSMISASLLMGEGNGDFWRSSAFNAQPSVSNNVPGLDFTGLSDQQSTGPDPLMFRGPEIGQFAPRGDRVFSKPFLLGNQPLHLAIIQGRVDIVKLLLRHGASINAAGFRQKTPLHLAKDSQAMMMLLLKNQPDLCCRDEDGNTALHLLLQLEDWWASVDCMGTLSCMLESGADINITNRAGASPFHLLIDQLTPKHQGYMNTILEFLKFKPSMSAPMPNGTDVFDCLIRKLEQTLRGKNFHNGRSWVAMRIGCECIYRFLDLGASPNACITEGKPFLHFCLEQDIFMKDYSLAELCMRLLRSSDVNLAGHDGCQTLHHVLSSCRISSGQRLNYVNVLIDGKVNVNHQDARGTFPLEILLSKSLSDSVQLVIALLRAGGAVMRLTSRGCTLFDLVVEKVFESDRSLTIKALLEADIALEPKAALPATYPLWMHMWRSLIKEKLWLHAKNRLLEFDASATKMPKEPFLQGVSIVVSEYSLKSHQTQLTLWLSGEITKEAASVHRQEYIAILADCRTRRTAIDPLFYEFLIDIMVFEDRASWTTKLSLPQDVIGMFGE